MKSKIHDTSASELVKQIQKSNYSSLSKKLALIFICLASINSLQAQWLLNVIGDGGNKKASVSENIGLAKITISYDRPGVKGREGKIWNTEVAHYGLKDLGFGTSTACPWRAGANENTTIAFSEDVKVEGKDIAAGTYGFHIILGETDDVLIFSKRNDTWGSFYYNPAEDALRVTIKHQEVATSTERLKYEFINQTENAVTVALLWEKRMFPFKIEAEVHKIQLTSFRHELDTKPGFNWLAYVQAARYCLDNNIELNQALIWADQGINERFVGQKNFQTLSTKANVLSRLGRDEESKKAMADALPMGSMIDLYQYGRSLINTKKPKEALAVFQLNYKKNPDVFNTNVGLGRAYSANGEYKKALPYIEKAIKQAPDAANKEYMEDLKAKLEKGMDIN